MQPLWGRSRRTISRIDPGCAARPWAVECNAFSVKTPGFSPPRRMALRPFATAPNAASPGQMLQWRQIPEARHECHGRQSHAAVPGSRAGVQEGPDRRGAAGGPEEDVDAGAQAQGQREAAGRAEDEESATPRRRSSRTRSSPKKAASATRSPSRGPASTSSSAARTPARAGCSPG